MNAKNRFYRCTAAIVPEYIMVAIDNTRALSPRFTYTIVTYVTDFMLSFHQQRQTRETVRQLSRLTDRELNDIGLTRGDVLQLARAGQL